jgi:type II secretory ATPase GspE/PulE/Tfp pilus assembly ATPase PilB-like protein
VRLFTLAVLWRASDIHADHIAGQGRVRFRVDGVLTEVVRMAPGLLARLVAELKPWMRLDPGDTQRAQDGRVTLPLLGRQVDLRASTLPTTQGESLAVRVLDRAAALMPLDALGLEPDQLACFRSRLQSNTGLIIVTGPAGCGRTTTVYAALSELNSEQLKVMTAEDPVQFELEGVVQSQIQPEFGVGYGRTLVSIMRQDPDIVFVGETRDRQVGDMVCRAALTGHIVLTTMHANDAPGAPIRLVDMGVDPHIVASGLLCVTAQRLVRATCQACSEAYSPSPDHLDLLGVEGADRRREFHRGRGCQRCNGTGYSGRIALFQLLDVTGPVREAIIAGETDGVRRAGRADGLGRTMAEVGAAKALRGETTVEEVARVLAE